MTIDLSKKLGQMFFVGFEGYALTKEIKEFLETIQPGGIILFENNIKDKKQVKKLINDINNCLEIKPFIAVDQEGGTVQRLKKICRSTPSVWELAKIGLKELLQGQKNIAKELLKLGFNMNLAPVLDINSNPKNPIIGKRLRAISSDPKIVASYGNAIIRIYIKNKIIPVAKHFPGHGGVEGDSHFDLPVLSKSLSELNKSELLPFKFAIKNKVPIIMVGHIQLPKLEQDKKRPGSLSKNLITNLLREKLKFNGLVITDELNMKGVTKNFSLEKAAYEATLAGADLLLFNYSKDKTFKVFEYLKRQTPGNKKLIKRIEESCKKIKKTKRAFLTNV